METMGVRATLSRSAVLAQIRKDLPFYILAGDKDPINHNLDG